MMQGKTKFLLIIIMILAIGLTWFYFFGETVEQTAPIHRLLFNRVPVAASIVVGQPVKIEQRDWCVEQNFLTSDDPEAPISDHVLGWNGVDGCCLRQVSGINCATGNTSVVAYCYTSIVGGEIKYLTVDNIYKDASLYKQFILDLDKEIIPNKPCDINKYR